MTNHENLINHLQEAVNYFRLRQVELQRTETDIEAPEYRRGLHAGAAIAYESAAERIELLLKHKLCQPSPSSSVSQSE